MPGFPNKIIINHGGSRGMALLINEDLSILDQLAIEFIALDKSGKLPLSDTIDLRDRLRKACDAHYQADMDYHNELKSIIEESERRANKALGLP